MGSRVQFEELFRLYAGAVRTYAARRGCVDDAEDVVAEVFVVAWRKLDKLPEDPLPWLLAVARRVLANRRRGDARRVALQDRLSGELSTSQGTEGLPAVDGAVALALAALDERDRELLLLVAWDGLRHADAARVLGLRTGTLTVRLHRARRRFARTLAEVDQTGSLELEGSEPLEAV